MTATLSPSPKQQFFDANGNPLVGGKLYSYSAGTTSPVVTYVDSAGVTTNTNPIILDSRGEANVWLGTGTFKFKLVSATDVEIWTVDNIPGAPASNAALVALAASNGSSLVGYLPAGTGAVATTVQSKLRESVSVKDFGAVGDGVTDDTAAIQAADNYTSANGYALAFEAGKTYSASELNIKSKYVYGNGATLVKNSTTATGFFNWGIKPGTLSNGMLRDLVIDASTANNVVNLRLYGNQESTKIRNVKLVNSDFYALGVGSLTSPGDKSDLINGLDIDGLEISSERGNTALGTTYSFGLEIFPGVNCSNYSIKNVQTTGKIINKIHSIDGLVLSDVVCTASSAFNPLSSAYCEINNCNNVVVDETCSFVGVGTTYYTFLFGNDRVSGGMPGENVRFSGRVTGRCAVSGASDFSFSSAVILGPLDLYSTITTIRLFSTRVTSNLSTIGTGSITNFYISDCDLSLIRMSSSTCVTTNFKMTGGIVRIASSNCRFEYVTKAVIQGTYFELSGTPSTYAISVQASSVLTLNGIYMNGNTDWNGPLFIYGSGSMRVMKSNFDYFLTSGLLASGSAALSVNTDNTVNGV